MTPKQREILDFIEAFIAQHRFAPTYTEIGAHVGTKSRGSVHTQIRELARQGKLKFDRNRRRGIEIVDPLSTISTASLRAELARRGAL